MTALLKYPGAKWSLAEWIIGHFPPHHSYLEPFFGSGAVLDFIKGCAYFIDRVKIGKLNYHPSDIDWAKFGREAEAACREAGLDYYIKDSLRKEMARNV